MPYTVQGLKCFYFPSSNLYLVLFYFFPLLCSSWFWWSSWWLVCDNSAVRSGCPTPCDLYPERTGMWLSCLKTWLAFKLEERSFSILSAPRMTCWRWQTFLRLLVLWRGLLTVLNKAAGKLTCRKGRLSVSCNPAYSRAFQPKDGRVLERQLTFPWHFTETTLGAPTGLLIKFLSLAFQIHLAVAHRKTLKPWVNSGKHP